MDKKNVIICYKHSAQLEANFESVEETNLNTRNMSIANNLPGFSADHGYAPVAVPSYSDSNIEEYQEFDVKADMRTAKDLTSSFYIIRGSVDEDKLDSFVMAAEKDEKIVGVYADPVISHFEVCPGSTAIGLHADVENKLGVQTLKNCGMTGEGVTVAIVDSGVNLDHLRAKGKSPRFNAADSWMPSSTLPGRQPGSMPVDHGTMVAYDVLIAAPECTLIDIALLQSRQSDDTVMSGFLSDAIAAYRHLMDIMTRDADIGKNKSLVVNNSWGMYNPSWDFPVGHSGNYSDNSTHPFNIIVRSLERLGADILFAAGNCGEECPSSRCQGFTASSIYGANSSPYVLTVAGVSIHHDRLGYSSIGPGRLDRKKPDISGYTHFKGSGVYPIDNGTSAACPVIASVIASIRNKKPLNLNDSQTRPAAIRKLITSTATDLGISGYDLRHGYGVVNTQKIQEKICPPAVIDICDRYPGICNFCKINPHICDMMRRWGFPGIPDFSGGPIAPLSASPQVHSGQYSLTAVDTYISATGNLNQAFQPAHFSEEFLRGMEFALTMQQANPSSKPKSVITGDCNCHDH